MGDDVTVSEIGGGKAPLTDAADDNRRRIVRFRSSIVVVDIVGAGAAAAALIGYFGLPFIGGVSPFLGQNGETALQSIGIELLGAWISVRLLEWVISRRNDTETARTRVLRHTRFWLTQFRGLKGTPHLREVERLQRELAYTTYMRKQSVKYLSSSEISNFDDIVRLIEAGIPIAQEVSRLRDSIWHTANQIDVLFRESNYAFISDPSDINKNVHKRLMQFDFILRDQLRLADGHIFDFDDCHAQVQNSLESIEKVSKKNDQTAKEVQAALERSANLIQKKKSLYDVIEDLESSVTAFEADIREETPERWLS
jgi:hypothetical protein